MGEAIQAYRGVTATEEFQSLEWMREKTRLDEAWRIGNARRQGAQDEREKWQGLVSEQAARIAALEARLSQK